MPLKLSFQKYQGLGNDFILLDAAKNESEILAGLTPEVIAYLCRRKYGIGADGIILLTSSDAADFAMRLFNADGSEAEISGNGLRCLTLFANDLKLTDKPVFTIQTGSGTNQVEILNTNTVRVSMPRPVFDGAKIPMLGYETCIAADVTIAGRNFNVTALSLGNPHCVLFDEFSGEEIRHWGPIIETSQLFPRRTNVGFAKILKDNIIELTEWERGVGLTDACGSGATAVVCAAVKSGKIPYDTEVTVLQIGGKLVIKAARDFQAVSLTGEAKRVYSGEVTL